MQATATRIKKSPCSKDYAQMAKETLKNPYFRQYQ